MVARLCETVGRYTTVWVYTALLEDTSHVSSTELYTPIQSCLECVYFASEKYKDELIYALCVFRHTGDEKK